MLPLRLHDKFVKSVDGLLKMLVILEGIPVAAPGEAMLGKETVAQIVLIDFIGEVLTAVGIDFTAGRGDIGIAVAIFVEDDVGVVIRIHVYGKAVGMFGEACGSIHHSVIKA